jgi:GNAT superfamily N-acetyltransferase
MVRVTGQAAAEEGPFTIPRALAVFVGGFTFTRSFTHPYHAELVGPVWVMRDAPRTKGDYRVEEWVAHRTAPEEVDRIARAETRGRFFVCAVHGTDEDDGSLRVAYKALGYRLMTTEPLMVHSLRQIPQGAAPVAVERVSSREMAERLAKVARTRQVLPEHLSADSPLWQYVAIRDGQLVGRVRSVRVGDAAWCSNMYVEPQFRRQGIGRAMLCQMLRDDRERGARASVLLASHTGTKLYANVCYEQIGTLLLYMLRRKKG